MSVVKVNFRTEAEQLDYELDRYMECKSNESTTDDKANGYNDAKCTSTRSEFMKKSALSEDNDVSMVEIETKDENRNVGVHHQSQDVDSIPFGSKFLFSGDFWKRSMSTYSSVLHGSLPNETSNQCIKPMESSTSDAIVPKRTSTQDDRGDNTKPNQNARNPFTIEAIPMGGAISQKVVISPHFKGSSNASNGDRSSNKIWTLPNEDLRHLLRQKRTECGKPKDDEPYDELKNYSMEIAKQQLRREEYLREKENRRRQQELMQDVGRSCVVYGDDMFH